jgi:hypothetical protein
MRFVVFSILLFGSICWAATSSELVLTEALLTEEISQRFSKKKGSSSSIGTDAMDLRTQAAWFYGEQPIVTCFNQTRTFGVSEDVSKKSIEAGLQHWRKYFQVNKIVKARAEFSPNTNFKFIGKCKGDEDLVVFLGTGPIFANTQDLKAAEKLNFPAAYANKTHMSRDMKWGKGYIRLVPNGYYGKVPLFPDWGRANALEGVLTHELGHVLGFLHAPGTLMQAELIDDAFSDKGLRQISIDYHRALISCADCEKSFRLMEQVKNPKFFKTMGFSDFAKVRLVKSKNFFTLTDGEKVFKVAETSRSSMNVTKSLISVFDEALNDGVEAFNLYGYLEKPKKTPLMLEVNSSSFDSAIVLRTIENDEFFEVGRFEAL